MSKYKPPESLYLEGRFNGGSFCVTGLGGSYLEGLIFGILRFTIFVRCRLKFQKKQFFLT